MPDHSQAIADLEEVLNAAETSTTVDGTSSTVNLNAARKRLAQLKREHTGTETYMVRPIMQQIRLG